MSDNCCEPQSSWLNSILNKILSALGQLTKATVDNKISVSEYPICDNGVQKIASVTYKNGVQFGPVQYFDKAHQTSTAPLNFALVAFGECGGSTVTPGEVLPVRSVVTTSGTITAGKYKVAVQNTGNAAGVFMGQVLLVGGTAEVTAYLDQATRVFYRLDDITYDATGTEFTLTVTP